MTRPAWLLAALAALAVAAAAWWPRQESPPPASAPTAGVDPFAGVEGELTLVLGHLGGAGDLPGRGTAARISWPKAVVAGPNGETYVVVSAYRRMLRVTADGAIEDVFPDGVRIVPTPPGDLTGGGVDITDFALAPDGAFIAVSGYQHVAMRIERDGTARVLAGRFAQPGHRDGPAARSRLNAPTSMALATDGTIYVAETLNAAIRRITPDGRVDTFYRGRAGREFGRTNPDARRPQPQSIAIDAAGRIWMTAAPDLSDGRNNAVFRLDPGGRIDATFGVLLEPGDRDGDAATARFNAAFDVVADPRDGVWVSERGAYHAIRRISADGIVGTIARTPCPTVEPCPGITPRYTGHLGHPQLAIGPMHRVVADEFHGALYRLEADGRTVPFAGLRSCVPATDGARADVCLEGVNEIAAHPDGSLVVIDGGRTLRRIERDGRTTTIVHADARLTPPAGATVDPVEARNVSPSRGLAVDAGGTIYYGLASDMIARREPDGRITLANPDPLAPRPGDTDPPDGSRLLLEIRGLVRMPDGALIASDPGGHVLKRVDPATGEVRVFAGGFEEPGRRDGPLAQARFDGPEQLALAPDGTLYVADAFGLRAISPAGVVSPVGASPLAPAADGCGERVEALAVGADGALWYATSNPPRVWRQKPGEAAEWIAGDRRYQGLRPGALPATLDRVRALLPTADGGVLIASGGALLKALPRKAAPATTAARDGAQSACRG